MSDVLPRNHLSRSIEPTTSELLFAYVQTKQYLPNQLYYRQAELVAGRHRFKICLPTNLHHWLPVDKEVNKVDDLVGVGELDQVESWVER
jgi:hypothetical protein